MRDHEVVSFHLKLLQLLHKIKAKFFFLNSLIFIFLMEYFYGKGNESFIMFLV